MLGHRYAPVYRRDGIMESFFQANRFKSRRKMRYSLAWVKSFPESVEPDGDLTRQTIVESETPTRPTMNYAI
jgi:hypothetical protein